MTMAMKTTAWYPIRKPLGPFVGPFQDCDAGVVLVEPCVNSLELIFRPLVTLVHAMYIALEKPSNKSKQAASSGKRCSNDDVGPMFANVNEEHASQFMHSLV